MKLKLIEKFHESLHSMSIRGHYIKHVDLQKRVKNLETDVKALKMEHDILYANSLKTDE
jgi:hypothetical protein